MKCKACIAPLLVLLSGQSLAGEWGQYLGTVVAKWMDDGRSMELADHFVYKDAKGKTWEAPAGSRVDGASIPRFAWSIIGGPFEGSYRNASVIHDVACKKQDEPWREVHETFYQAMRASGVDQLKAKVMYAAVYHFGPRWQAPKVRTRAQESTAAVATAAVAETSPAVAAGDLASHQSGVDREFAAYRQERPSQTVALPPEAEPAEFTAMRAAIERDDLPLERIRDLVREEFEREKAALAGFRKEMK